MHFKAKGNIFMICSKTERIKKFIVLSCIVLCVFLCTSCSAGKTDNIAADAVISSVKEKIKNNQSENEEVFSTPSGTVILKDFLCYCQFNARVSNSDYNSEETIEETVKSFALAAEAQNRGVVIPNEDNKKIDSYTQQYVNEQNYIDFPVETYKEVCRMSYLESKVKDQIQEEIISGNIKIDDKNTKRACEKYVSYVNKAESQSKNWSDEQKEDELDEFYELYNNAEEAYIDFLIEEYLSVKY